MWWIVEGVAGMREYWARAAGAGRSSRGGRGGGQEQWAAGGAFITTRFA